MTAADDSAAARAARARRLAEIFGEVLPEQTADDTGAKTSATEETARERQMIRDVPPHHGT